MTHHIRSLAVMMVALLLAATLAGCASTPKADDGDTLTVTVSITPQKFFVERIGGELVDVNVMVEPGASPATYEPKPAQLTALADSAAYFAVGVAFEDAWLDRIAAANPDMLVIDTAEGIKRLPMDAHHHDEESGQAVLPSAATAAPDPHVWLSPSLVAVQARAIAITLGDLDPAHIATYNSNLNAFLQELDALDTEIRQALAGVEGRAFMVFHPSWGYFAADYGLEQIAVEIGGQEPSARELAALIEEAEHEGIQVVFAQPEFSTRAAETIAKEIGGEVLLISPLAEDWMDNMRAVADAFAQALAKSATLGD